MDGSFRPHWRTGACYNFSVAGAELIFHMTVSQALNLWPGAQLLFHNGLVNVDYVTSLNTVQIHQVPTSEPDTPGQASVLKRT